MRKWDLNIGWSNVHALILQPMSDGTYSRLGTVLWSRLGIPLIDKNRNVLRVKELFEARRVVPSCECECKTPKATLYDHYMEDNNHVMELKRVNIQLV
jgi:hypothetical protein